MNPFGHDLTIVMRSVGERTERLCHALAEEQVPASNIVVIQERPFGAAVRRTLQIGRERARRWTLGLDADVLLRSGAVRDMIEWAEACPDPFFFANFTVADKLLGAIRDGGAHLYRTALLDEAAARAGEDIDLHRRPESLVRARMSVAGFPAYQLCGLVIGLHDFEQSYRDIYRTAYVHQLKHPTAMMTSCRTAWARLKDTDLDFHVALAGAQAAERRGGSAAIDDRLFPQSIGEIGELDGLKEKPPLSPDALDPQEVSRRLGEFCPFHERIRVIDKFHCSRALLGLPPLGPEHRGDSTGRLVGVRLPWRACRSILRGGVRLARRLRDAACSLAPAHE